MLDRPTTTTTATSDRERIQASGSVMHGALLSGHRFGCNSLWVDVDENTPHWTGIYKRSCFSKKIALFKFFKHRPALKSGETHVIFDH